MRVAIRTDSSVDIGSGHVMRCLTLASKLAERKADVFFICRELSGSLIPLIESKGFRVLHLPAPHAGFRIPAGAREYEGWLQVSKPQDAKETIDALGGIPRPDWLIIDHYAIDIEWQSALRPYAGALMVIDDLADRRHDCDLLLDQNLFERPEGRYDGLVGKKCVRLIGPSYMLLRPEFMEARKNLRQRDGSIKRMLVFFGGSDPTNETTKALKALGNDKFKGIRFDVVVGGSNTRKKEIERLVAVMPSASFHCQIDNMCALMQRADLAIGACGTTAWERCALALPSVVLITADNQAEIAKALDKTGAAIILGRSGEVTERDISEVLGRLIDDPQRLKEVAQKAGCVTDGSGADRVADAMMARRHSQ